MGIYERYIKAGKAVEPVTVPRLAVRFRDGLCVKGKKMKIPYGDITKFVKRGDTYLPLFVVEDVGTDDLVLDFSPLICTGIPELLFVTSNAGDNIGTELMKDLVREYPPFADSGSFLHALDTVTDISTEERKRQSMFLASLRTDYKNCAFPSIQNFAGLLMVYYMTSPETFCRLFCDLSQFLIPRCGFFTLSMEDTVGVGSMSGDGEFGMTRVEDIVPVDSLAPEAYRYKNPGNGTAHAISNGRGLSVYACILLLYYLYDICGELLGKDTYTFARMRITPEDLQERFSGCIGDDNTGKFLKKGKIPEWKVDYDAGFGLLMTGQPYGNLSTVYTTEGGLRVGRELYEDFILLPRMNRMRPEDAGGTFCRCPDVYYYPTGLLPSAAANAFTAQRDFDELICPKEEKDHICPEDVRRAVSDAVQKQQAASARKQEEAAQKQKEQADAYEAQIAELKRQLASKAGIIEALTKEAKEARDHARHYYAEEDAISLPEAEDLSMGDMVTYLNQFKVVMVGGRMDLSDRLAAIGWTSVTQLDSIMTANNTPVIADFFCINTRFISHAVEQNIESRYRDQKSQFFYYNGTNTDALVRVCYDFITKWISA